MKIGDLVRSTDEYDDEDVGIVIDFPPADHGQPRKRKVLVYWPEPLFGKQYEWDWESDLEVCRSS
jgi:hypothetical protein